MNTQVNANHAQICVYPGGVDEWTPEAICDFRNDHHWTQDELAERIGAHPRSVSGWETGETKIGRLYARALSRLKAELEGGASPAPPAPTIIEAADEELVAELLHRLGKRRRRARPSTDHDLTAPHGDGLADLHPDDHPHEVRGKGAAGA